MDKSDYELVYLAQEGNEDAINLLYQNYKPIIGKKSKNAIIFATHHGIDINDIMQEGYIGFEEAIRNFSQDENASFYTFAMLCIDRQIVNYLRKTTGSRGRILNEAITIDDTLEKVLGDGTNIESNLMGKDRDSELILIIRNMLTDFERTVFDLKLEDYTFDEISKILNKDVKSIYNTFQRIKMKMKKNIKIDD
jgi:RNA polymerase sporulation-specific sigma factor